MEKYFYAKIGDSNSLAEDYLAGENEIGSPTIPIYFDGSSADKTRFLEEGSAREQGRNLFECGQYNNGKNIIIVHNGVVTIASPSSDVILKNQWYTLHIRVM